MGYKDLTYSKRGEQARQYFLQGYNCSQSVVLAFSDLIDVDKDKLLCISSSFGGGIGRLREVCGAVSGVAMVMGYLFGYTDPEEKKGKAELYAEIQTVLKEFEAYNSSIVCRELLKKVPVSDGSAPADRTAVYYDTRPCSDIVACAATLLERYIEGKNCDMNKAVCEIG